MHPISKPEAMDEPIDQHRVMADDFLDLLLRFRSVQEEKAIKKAESEAERKALRTGALPSKLGEERARNSPMDSDGISEDFCSERLFRRS